MATPTDERRDLLTVIVHMRAKPGREQQLRDELTALVEPTSKEDGFVNYDLHVSIEDPAVFFLYENWESGEALDTHFQAPHLVRFVSLTDELLDGGLNLTRLQRIA
jgi:quinol monooxygenase YgiN